MELSGGGTLQANAGNEQSSFYWTGSTLYLGALTAYRNRQESRQEFANAESDDDAHVKHGILSAFKFTDAVTTRNNDV